MNNVLQWLEAAAHIHPEKIACADTLASVSYAELLHRARTLGRGIAQAVSARSAIALYLDKDIHAVSCLLGVVYAACCYSFIDLRQPAARVEKIVATLQPALVITDAAYSEQAHDIFPHTCRIMLLDELMESAARETSVAAEPQLPANTQVAAETNDASLQELPDILAQRRAQALSTDPVYVNFTSGSTGTPKGVAVAHASLIDFIPVFVRSLKLKADDVFACQAPFDFDVSVKDVYGALCLGATLHLIPREFFSEPVRLMDYLVERKPTVLVWAVSAMCFVSIMGGFEYKVPETVRLVAFSGEVMPPKQLRAWQEALPHAEFYNVYGPTEITCNCTYFPLTRTYADDEVIPMGKAFENEHVFLLDEEGREVVAPHVPGELYVGGATLALGYYRDAERTAAAFVQNPANDAFFERVYKTGDLACYNDEADLVYLSRVDHQIKHMGQRIELGEIDAAAHAVEAVTRACAIYDASRKRIRLFYTGAIEKKELSAALKEALPPYMTPNNIRQLSEMPLNKNGKIDRGKLERGELG